MEVNAKNMLLRVLELVHQIHSSLRSHNIPQCSVNGNKDTEMKTQSPEKKRSFLIIFTLMSKVHSIRDRIFSLYVTLYVRIFSLSENSMLRKI